jgi:uncharacterized protein YdgA (DUF945 family)
MSKIATAAGIGAVVVLGGVLASPALVGQGVAATLKNTEAALLTALKNQPTLAEVVRLKSSTYQGGFLNSSQDMVFSVGCPGTPESTITLRNRVDHGPLPGFSRLGLAAVKSEVVFSGQTDIEVTKLFAGKRLGIESQLGFDGRLQSILVVPAVNDGTTDWDELRVRLELNPRNPQDRATFTIDNWRVTTKTETIRLRQLQIQNIPVIPSATYPKIPLGETELRVGEL